MNQGNQANNVVRNEWQKVQRTNNTTSCGNTSTIMPNADEASRVKHNSLIMWCVKCLASFRCGQTIHLIKDCKARPICINCGKHNLHLS
jgi:hypothetical protein